MFYEPSNGITYFTPLEAECIPMPKEFFPSCWVIRELPEETETDTKAQKEREARIEFRRNMKRLKDGLPLIEEERRKGESKKHHEDYMRWYYRMFREDIKASQRERYASMSEEERRAYIDRQLDYIKRNKERRSEYNKKRYYAMTPEQKAERSRRLHEYYIEHREKWRNDYHANRRMK